ncbi:ASCH domain-containing protein, partial [Durusdinium trenchii]
MRTATRKKPKVDVATIRLSGDDLRSLVACLFEAKDPLLYRARVAFESLLRERRYTYEVTASQVGWVEIASYALKVNRAATATLKIITQYSKQGQLLSGLDSITRTMAGIPNDVIEKFPPVAHVELRKRLLEQADRYTKQEGSGKQYLTTAELAGYVTGAIVATCDLVACVELDSIRANTRADCHQLEVVGISRDQLLAHEHAEGPWCWVLSEVRPVVEPSNNSDFEDWTMTFEWEEVEDNTVSPCHVKQEKELPRRRGYLFVGINESLRLMYRVEDEAAVLTALTPDSEEMPLWAMRALGYDNAKLACEKHLKEFAESLHRFVPHVPVYGFDPGREEAVPIK